MKLSILTTLMLTFAIIFPYTPNAASQHLAQKESSASSDLISPTTGVNYTTLRNLLSQEEWRKANNETAQLMLQATEREIQGWVSAQDISQLACWDLQTIDNLWKSYSGGRFGFSAQFPIFINSGNRPGRLVAIEAYEEFGDRVGWRQPSSSTFSSQPQNQWITFKENLNYSLNAPVGHLPNPRQEYQITGGRLGYVTLAQRMVECNVASYPRDRSSPVRSLY